MKRITIITLMLFCSIALLFSCTNKESDSDEYSSETTISYPITDTTTEGEVIFTSPPPQTPPPTPRPPTPPHFYAGMSVPMPENITVIEDDWRWPAGRSFRAGFYGIEGRIVELIGWQTLNEWVEQNFDFSREITQSVEYAFIKDFNIEFEIFRNVSIRMFEIRQDLNQDITYEYNEIPNPYILFTFNTERINQFYSIDHAEHAEARQWLIDWLEAGNVPYESYSAFRAANPQ